MQVPGNFGAPSHVLVRELAASGASRCAARAPSPSPRSTRRCSPATGADVDVWETTYLHRLTGPDPVLEWIGSTALRPVRDALDDVAYALPCRAGPAAAGGVSRAARTAPRGSRSAGSSRSPASGDADRAER